MDAVRIGLSLRALRHQRRWLQVDVAKRAGVSQAAVSRAERGQARGLTLRTLERIGEGLGARVMIRIAWHGEELDRLLDAEHAALVEASVQLLRSRRWEVATEVTFSVYGERGAIDILAFHGASRALLMVEVKSVVPDLQAMLAGIDRKGRLAIGLARQRGWSANRVSRLLILGESRTSRRRLVTNAATLDAQLPSRGRPVRAWLAEPTGSIGGILFLSATQRTTPRQRVRRSRASTSDT